MAKNKPLNVDTLPTVDTLGPNIRVYKNGALFDTDKGKIVGMRPELAIQPTLITKENTSEYLSKRVSRKREIIEQAANDAVESATLRKIHGSDAWIAEIGGAMQRKATNIDDPKMVDAARFLLTETGISDKQQVGAANQAADVVGQALLALLAHVTRNDRDIVNGEVKDADV